MRTGRLINKDYRYLYEMCVETGLSQALALNSACVVKKCLFQKECVI